MKKLFELLLWPVTVIKRMRNRRLLKKRLEELSKKDPFIYK